MEGVNLIKGITIWWTYERDQVNMIEFLKTIMLTHGTKYLWCGGIIYHLYMDEQ